MEGAGLASLEASNNPAVKRLLREARELREGACSDFHAAPLDDNLFEWHFTIAGPDGTAFEGGRFHGRILLPNEYPFKPPAIMILTPNGRFEVGQKICLSISAHHPENWQPAWGVRTMLTALVGFMPSKAEGALGGIDYTDAERRALALRSLSWRCARCGLCMADALPAASSRDAHAVAPGDEACVDCTDEATGGRAEPPDGSAHHDDAPHARGAASAATAPAATSPSVGVAPASMAHAPPTRAAPPRADGLLLLACALAVAIVALVARKMLRALE